MTPTRVVDLCGTWTFTPITAAGACGPVQPIPVPSQWTHGTAWNLPSEWAAVEEAWIEREVTLPTAPTNGQVRLRFAAVMLACDVYLDDQRIGGHVGGYTPFTIDVSAHAGRTARLRVRVTGSRKASAAGEAWLWPVSYPTNLEEGPMPAGIWQPVSIELAPAIEVTGWRWQCGLPGKPLELWATVHNHSDAQRTITVAGTLADSELTPTTITLPAKGSIEVAWRHKVRSLARWSPEQPTLHPLQFSAEGHVLRTRIGLRHVRCRARRVELDGVPRTLLGLSVVRHRISPHMWRRDYCRLFFAELRRLGFNSIRTHGAICPPVLLEVADEVGLLVEDQSSLWSNAVRGFLQAPEAALANALTEQQAWIERDRNHPSVFAWDVENEYVRIMHESKPWIASLVQAAKAQDPSRPVIASAAGSWPVSDIHHQHCAQGLDAILRRWLASDSDYPHVMGEWWPDTVAFGTWWLLIHGQHHPGRPQIDPLKADDVITYAVALYAREMRRHRLLGASGTYPFSLETLLFEPLFAPEQALTVPVRADDPVTFTQPDHFVSVGVHNLRRPYVNPGWAPGPRVTLRKPACALVSAALTPVLIGLVEDARTVAVGGTYRATLAVCNDSDAPLVTELTILVGDEIVGRAAVRVQIGTRVARHIDFPAPRAAGRFAMRARWTAGEAELGTLLVQPVPASLALTAAGTGLNQAQRQLFKGLEVRLVDTPAPGGLWLLGDGAETTPAALATHLESGGSILALRQSSTPAWLPPVLGLRNLCLGNAHSDIDWGMEDASRERRFLPWVGVASPAHPALDGVVHEDRLGPWMGSDGRVADDQITRLVEAAHAGAVTTIARGAADDSATLVEVRAGNGRFIACQLDLRAEDAQARLLCANLLRCAMAPLPAERGVLFAGPEALDDQAALAAVRAGGVLVIQETGSIAAPAPGSWLASVQDRDAMLAGVLASDLDLWTGDQQHAASVDGLLPRGERGWRDAVLAFGYAKETAVAACPLTGPLGCVAQERRLGRGTILRTTLRLDADHPKAVRLRERLAANAHGPAVPTAVMVAPPSAPVPTIRHLLKAVPLDGDVGKWTDEERDPNVNPWSRAEAIVLDRRNGDLDPTRHGAIGWLLWSNTGLHLSLLSLCPTHRFGDDGQPWNRSSCELFIGPRQVVVAADSAGAGSVVAFGPPLAGSGLAGIACAVHRLAKVPGIADVALLPGLTGHALEAVLFQLTIPWETLGRSAPTPGERLSLGLVLNLADPTRPGVRAGQLAAPLTQVYQEPATYWNCQVVANRH